MVIGGLFVVFAAGVTLACSVPSINWRVSSRRVPRRIGAGRGRNAVDDGGTRTRQRD
jgi:hypothetical protein